MGHLEQRLFRINDAIARLGEQARLTAEELNMLEHIDDDAQRDASVGGPLERDDARITGQDVDRFRRALDAIVAKRTRLESKRDRLLKRLG